MHPNATLDFRLSWGLERGNGRPYMPAQGEASIGGADRVHAIRFSSNQED